MKLGLAKALWVKRGKPVQVDGNVRRLGSARNDVRAAVPFAIATSGLMLASESKCEEVIKNVLASSRLRIIFI